MVYLLSVSFIQTIFKISFQPLDMQSQRKDWWCYSCYYYFFFFSDRKQECNFACPSANVSSSREFDCLRLIVRRECPDGCFQNQPMPMLGGIHFTFRETLSFTHVKVYTLPGLQNQALRIKQTWIKLVSFWEVKPHKTLILGCTLMKYHDSKDY